MCYNQSGETTHSWHSLCLVRKKVPVIALITNNLCQWLAKQTNKKWQTPIIQLKCHMLSFSGKVEDLVFLSLCSFFTVILDVSENKCF